MKNYMPILELHDDRFVINMDVCVFDTKEDAEKASNFMAFPIREKLKLGQGHVYYTGEILEVDADKNGHFLLNTGVEQELEELILVNVGLRNPTVIILPDKMLIVTEDGVKETEPVEAYEISEEG